MQSDVGGNQPLLLKIGEDGEATSGKNEEESRTEEAGRGGRSRGEEVDRE